MIPTYTYSGVKKQGPRLLLLGAVHGNEHGGTQAIHRLMTQLDKEKLILQSGTLLCVPIINQKAYTLDQRYIDQDLNRVCQYRDCPSTYEQHLANDLVKLIGQADVVLDLHSFHSQGVAFVCDDYPNATTKKIVSALPFAYVVQSWQKLPTAQNTQDTMKCAHQLGKVGILLEGGNHRDPTTGERLYEALLITLQQLGMVAGGSCSCFDKQTTIVAKESYIKQQSGSFVRSRKEFEYITQGTPLFRYDDGTVFSAPYDAYILLPNEQTKVGEEWFYLGI